MSPVRQAGAPQRRADGRDRWLFPSLGAAGLLVSVVLDLLTEGPATARPFGTVVLGSVTAAWLFLSAPLYPNRHSHPRLVLGYYAGILVLTVLLVTRSPSFLAFTWIGYPYGFALFRAPWVLVAVAVTALVQYVTMLTVGVPSDALVYVLPVGIFTPVLVAGWIAVTEAGRRQRVNAALTEANRSLAWALEENAGLHEELVLRAREAGRLDERQRLAREIHDTIAQGLTGVVTHVRAACRASDDPDRRRFHLDRVESLAQDSLEEARRSVQALRPGHLELSRLPEAMSTMAERWSSAHGIPVAVEVTGAVTPLRTATEITLFRVAQEALTNVGRHAGATRVGLSLSYADDVVLLDVRDDGVGFAVDAAPAPTSFGLDGMRQRLRSVGGELTVESAPGEGTAVGARVPATPAAAGG